MKRGMRWFAVGPVAFAAAFLLVAVLTVGTAGFVPVVTVGSEIAKLVEATGCIAAALAFERRDYMRRAWGLIGACFVILLLRDVTIFAPLPQQVAGVHVNWVRGILVLAANASAAVGIALLARAWSAAAIEEQPSRLGDWATYAIAVVIGLAAGGWPLIHHLRLAMHGAPWALSAFGSDLGDIVSLVLLVPVARTAFAVRGGVLLWPWGLATAGGLCWMLYDASSSLAAALQTSQPGFRIAIEVSRALACAFFAAAGLAQRRIATSTRSAWAS